MNPKRILIVEDNDLDFEQAEMRLRETGEAVEIVRAKRLGEAEEILKKRKNFEIIFLDPGLPDVTDPKYEAFGRLCKLGISPDIIRVVTGNEDSQMKQIIQDRGSQVVGKDQALRGDALVEQTFGLEFLINRMKSYEGRLSEHLAMLLARETIPFKSEIELLVGKLRVEVDENRRSIAKVEALADRFQEVIMRIDLIGGVATETQKSVGEIKKKIADSENRTAVQIERTKGLSTVAATIVTATVTLLVTLISTGQLQIPGNSKDPEPSTPTPSAPP